MAIYNNYFGSGYNRQTNTQAGMAARQPQAPAQPMAARPPACRPRAARHTDTRAARHTDTRAVAASSGGSLPRGYTGAWPAAPGRVRAGA